MTKMTNHEIVLITFDLDPGDDSIPQEEIDQVQKELQEEYIGQVYSLFDPDDLADIISDETGWCIKSITTIPVQ